MMRASDATGLHNHNHGKQLVKKPSVGHNKPGLQNSTTSLPHEPGDTCNRAWTYADSDSGYCKCGDEIHYLILCNNVSDHISILTCSCMTYDPKDGVVIGYCPYGCNVGGGHLYEAKTYTALPSNKSEINNAMCGRLNREGRLCGKCRDNYRPLAYSYELSCVPCTYNGSSNYNWMKFAAAALVPVTTFYFMVILFRIDATNPYLYGYIMLNQALGAPVNLRVLLMSLSNGGTGTLVRIITIPYSIWNLDYFRSLRLNICLDLTTLETLALDYVISVYPLVLILTTYVLVELHARGCRLIRWLWRPFHGCCVRFTRIMDIQSSIIKAFATFILLSYVKLVNSTGDMLLFVRVYNMHRKVVGTYVFYDATYVYFGKEHLPYAIMGIMFFIAFVLTPLILLLFYQTRCFQRCLDIFRLRCHALQVFVDTFQGHYKDGIEPGTRDCRWFAAVYFLGRMIILYGFYAISEDVMCYFLTGISLLFLALFMIMLRPYRSGRLNIYHTVMVMYIGIVCFAITAFDEATIKGQWIIQPLMTFILVLAVLPTLALVSYIGYRVLHQCCKVCKLKSACHTLLKTKSKETHVSDDA